MPLMDLLAREARFGRARSLADGSLPLGPAQRRGLQRQRLRLQAHRLVRGDGTLARLWPPTPPLVFSFFFRAVLGFAVVGVAACGGVTVEFGAESNRVQLWGSFRFLSVGLAVGATLLSPAHSRSLPGWPLGAFVATATYLVVVGAESTAACRRTLKRPLGTTTLASPSMVAPPSG
jgi:hypothetical protein